MRKRRHSLRTAAASVWDNLCAWLFPPRCFVCDELLAPADLRCGSRIHAACGEKLFPVRQPYCCHCGSPLSDGRREYCDDCSRKHSLIDEGRSLFAYRGDVRFAMYRFKYGNRRQYAHFLAEEAVSRLGGWMREKDVELIVPVPLYRRKKQRRGYNQAALFAKALSEACGIPWSEPVIRVRDTQPQKELSGREREKNVRNAFLVRPFGVEYKKILIIDDIYTTGATVEAVAAELRKAGAEHVYVLTACIGRGF